MIETEFLIHFESNPSRVALGRDLLLDSKWIADQSQEVPLPRSLFLISDTNTAFISERLSIELERCGHSTACYSVPAGEVSKSPDALAAIWKFLTDRHADRASGIIAVGGGVVGDLAGFAAATYMRGIDWINVPTSLIAQVDSAIGGKVGINLPQGKNLAGAFWQPRSIWLDVATLASLPDREFRSGFAEVVKYGIISSPELFEQLENDWERLLGRDPAILSKTIIACAKIKAAIVEADEREQSGLRAKLNYGHTFGHAIENLSGYGHFLHGEAIAIGMVWAARTAQLMGLIDESICQRQRALLADFGLPTDWPDVEVERLLAIMKLDKKRLHGHARLILPHGIGKVETVNWPGDELICRAIGAAGNKS